MMSSHRDLDAIVEDLIGTVAGASSKAMGDRPDTSDDKQTCILLLFAYGFHSYP